MGCPLPAHGGGTYSKYFPAVRGRHHDCRRRRHCGAAFGCAGSDHIGGIRVSDGRCGSAGDFRHDEGLLRPGAHHCDCHDVFCRDELGRSSRFSITMFLSS